MLSLIFSIDNHILAIPLENVIRVVLAVYIEPHNESSDNILGMMNLENEILPVLNLRKMLNFKEKQLELNDKFIICLFKNKKIVLWVDNVDQIIEFTPQEINASSNAIQYDSHLISIIPKKNEMIFFYDWEKLFESDKSIHNHRVIS